MYCQHFFSSFQIFFTKNIPWRSKLKIYCNFPYLWHFLDMLKEQVLGGSMWNIRVLTVDNMKICQFLGIFLFLGNLNLCNIFFRKVSTFIASNKSKSWLYCVFSKTTILMNFQMSHYFWLRSFMKKMIYLRKNFVT